MKSFILVAPNAYKGSLTASEICHTLIASLSDGCRRFIPLPMGDGGDGTAEIIASYLNAAPVECRTLDALGRPKNACYHITPEKTAIIELAAICGLKDLERREYDITHANTAGLGRVINEVANRGINRILLCVGGSASVDGGTGALSAMGMKIVRSKSYNRNYLIDIQNINIHHLQEKFSNIHFTILCDVENPLTGESGAAPVFGPQKGASPSQVVLLDTKLNEYALLLLSKTGKEVRTLKYGGAAGGIAASFSALFDAELVSGADFCLRLSGFDRYLSESILVVTGEGKLDAQSLCGKIPGVIARKSYEKGVRVIAIAGSSEISGTGLFDRIFSLTDYAPDAETSIKDPVPYLRALCKDVSVYLDQL